MGGASRTVGRSDRNWETVTVCMGEHDLSQMSGQVQFWLGSIPEEIWALNVPFVVSTATYIISSNHLNT